MLLKRLYFIPLVGLELIPLTPIVATKPIAAIPRDPKNLKRFTLQKLALFSFVSISPIRKGKKKLSLESRSFQ